MRKQAYKKIKKKQIRFITNKTFNIKGAKKKKKKRDE